MAEVEIHTGHDHSSDEFGRRVGVIVGVIGIVLAVVTIASHRAHTAAVIARTEANDQWSFYQAKKLRQHLAEISSSLASSLASDPARVQGLVTKLDKDRERYSHESEDIQKEALAKDKESSHEEVRAFRFDMGEGFLELGLVLSSLYFLSKQRLFPLIGGLAALIGLGLGVAGFLV
ncbi:MAG TPA: DUF4337 domain-containing protein [Steroidobacteraceae bacterium]|nr:DUF4337 domain-containing protein [Steroidobacteraceae bacterium]